MNYKVISYISGKLLNANNRRYSGVVIKIAIIAIAISISVMIVAISVLKGFQQEISNKIIGFSGHIHVSNFTSNISLQSESIAIDKKVKNNILQLIPKAKVTAYAIKGGIIKTKTNIEGAVLKGLDTDYDWQFFKSNLVFGRVPNLKTDSIHEIMLSKNIASKLELKLSDNLFMFFIQQPARIRKFKIVGIYNTGLEEFDNKFLFCGLYNVQKLNNWKNNEADALEVLLSEDANLQQETEKLYNNLPPELNVESVNELYPQLFDWLALQNLNVIIIIIMMLLVGTINMITALLIIILEKTKTVGLLKALGANNSDIRKIFILNSSKLILKGALLGNLIGISLICIQHYLKVIPLDASSYYMQFVPIKIDVISILLINLVSISISITCMVIPTLIIRKISPATVMRF